MTPPPFSLRPAAPGCPLVVSVTHAGRAYPPDLTGVARGGSRTLEQLEDPLVDELAAGVRDLGAGLAVAHAPRAYVDLNRAPDDLEPSAVRGHARLSPTARARIGLGVVPTRLPGAGALWRRPLAATELTHRIEGVHAPFHGAVARELARVRDACGTALLLDLHSMPPLNEGVAVVFGDRHGSACAPYVLSAAERAAARAGLPSRANAPYAGGYTVARHGRPVAGVHALQVELSRDLYLDTAGRRPGPGWQGAQSFVHALAGALIEELAPEAWARAAE